MVGLVVNALNLDDIRSLELAKAGDKVDVVLLEQELNTLVHSGCHHTLTLDHLCPVGLNLALDGYAVGSGSLAVGKYLC